MLLGFFDKLAAEDGDPATAGAPAVEATAAEATPAEGAGDEEAATEAVEPSGEGGDQ